MIVNPLVSIVIPVYNGSDYVGEAIESALNQTYPNIEVIVVNDGSKDNGKTDQVLKMYNGRIIYITKENGGVSTAFNVGIKAMNGSYFSWLSHDDVYYPNKIQDQIDFLRSNNLFDKEVVLYSDYDVIDSKSVFVKSRSIRHVEPDRFRWLMLTTYPVNGNTVLIPRQCFNKVGLFNEAYKTQQDYDMWARLSVFYPFYHMSKSLIKSRAHSEQGTILLSELMKKNNYDFFKSFLNSFDNKELLSLSKRTSLQPVYRYLAYTKANQSEILSAKYCCFKCKSINDSNFNKIFYQTDLMICNLIYGYRLCRTALKNLLNKILK